MRFGTSQDAGGDETFLEANRFDKVLVIANRRNEGIPPGGVDPIAIGVCGIGQVATAGYSRGYGVQGASILPGGVPTGVVGFGWSTDNTGVMGWADDGSLAYGVWGRSRDGFAGVFSGKVSVTGQLTKASGGFKIDHPIDPENKYLIHSFVESPDMLNVYSGNVETDDAGEAVVELPRYFEALNQDFTYQLTSIGQFTQAIVAEEVHENRFSVRTDKPNVKVSWQVTGVRKDPYAALNRIEPEESKSEEEQGLYLHPEVYGQPRSRHVHFERENAHESSQEKLKEQAERLFERLDPPPN
jgi:hypothetical protein